MKTYASFSMHFVRINLLKVKMFRMAVVEECTLSSCDFFLQPFRLPGVTTNR